MDGLLIILSLIIWFVSRSKKKKTARVRTVVKQTQKKTVTFPSVQPQELQVSMFEPEPEPEPVAADEGVSFETIDLDGSLNAETHEGEDLCDPTLGHEDRYEFDDPDSVYANEIGHAEPLLDLSPRGLWQGVVMSEVLARPSQRRIKH